MGAPATATKVDGKTLGWDGVTYESQEAAEAAAEGYRRDGFEVRILEHESKHLVYTRRVVSQTAAPS